jgi:hypothetical protein
MNARVAIYRISMFIIRIINKLDEKYPEILYLLPETFVEVPFEVFRVLKRGNLRMYETEEERRQYQSEYKLVYT